MSYAVVVVGRDGRPFFLVDEEGEPAVFSDESEAEDAQMGSPASISLPSIVVELPESDEEEDE